MTDFFFDNVRVSIIPSGRCVQSRRGQFCHRITHRTVPLFEGQNNGKIPGGIMASTVLATLLAPQINFPSDFKTNLEMLLRWIHFLAGITWIGLLYFFNLVNVPLMKELDASTKGKVMPALMTRALWWFRMSAALTVLAGFMY